MQDRAGKADWVIMGGVGLGVAGMVVGGLIIVVNSIFFGTTTSPYNVDFKDPGDHCSEESDDDADPIISRETGELLVCTRTWNISDASSDTGEFSADEIDRLTKLSESRARDGGLNEADESAVERLVDRIGRSHGYEPRREHMSGTIASYIFAGGMGLGLLTLAGGWVAGGIIGESEEDHP